MTIGCAENTLTNPAREAEQSALLLSAAVKVRSAAGAARTRRGNSKPLITDEFAGLRIHAGSLWSGCNERRMATVPVRATSRTPYFCSKARKADNFS